MKLDVGVGIQPMFVLLVGVEIVENDVKLAARTSRGNAVHEVEKFDAAPSFRVAMIFDIMNHSPDSPAVGGTAWPAAIKERRSLVEHGS